MGSIIDTYKAEQAERFKRTEERRKAKRASRGLTNGRIVKVMPGGRTMPMNWAKEMFMMLRLMPKFANKRQRKLYSRWRRGKIGTKAFKEQMAVLASKQPAPMLDKPDYAMTAEDLHSHHDHDGHHH